MAMAKIMIIEDSDAQRDLFAAALQVGGHDVRSVADVPAALRALATERFDLVVTDIFMPDCDGFEFIRNVRRSHRELPLVAMSAGHQGSGELFLRMAKVLGADLVLDKARGPRELVSAIDGYLAGRRAAAARSDEPGSPTPEASHTFE